MSVRMQPHFLMERKFQMEMLGRKTKLTAVLKSVCNMCNSFQERRTLLLMWGADSTIFSDVLCKFHVAHL